MKNLKQYIQEKLIVSKDYTYQYVHKYHPKSWDELREIIIDRYEQQGPGTEQEPIDLNDIDVSRIDTFFNDSSNTGLFEGIPFEYIDISKWDVWNVENMNSMFNNCQTLKSVGDLSKWDISSVKNMNYMFRNCKNLKSVGDLSNWNISNIDIIHYMFTFFDSGITNIPDWYKK